MMVLNYTAQQRANLRANPLAPISIGHLIADCDALTLYANQQEKLAQEFKARGDALECERAQACAVVNDQRVRAEQLKMELGTLRARVSEALAELAKVPPVASWSWVAQRVVGMLTHPAPSTKPLTRAELVEALLACAPSLNHSLARLANHLRG